MLPADVLPHGLGKIHAPRTDGGAMDNGSGLAPLATNIAGEELELGTSQAMLRFLSQFVQGMVEEAARSEANPLGEAAGQSRQTRSSTSLPRDTDDQLLEGGGKMSVNIPKAKRVPRKTKDNPYGLMPGRTPFPDWTGPTPEMCAEVHQLLTDLHGEFKAPNKIPAPSTSVAGCGEVPDLVDAMIRTLISGHTTMANANLAIRDIIDKYGQWPEDSIGAGSIDWNKVRLSDVSEIVHAVRRAGLGRTKGNDIKLILEQVFQENQQRQSAYLEEKNSGEKCTMGGCNELSQGQKDHQLLKIENGVLTLDHIRGLTPEDAMLEFTKYPGIGVKTASCLILFCLQQPSFAVDTHVWRFCKWLKWVPPNANRDDTYMHGEVRIPDNLKYGLHQLFIRHGKECGRCRSGTVEGTVEWESVVCPLEHLLDRFDKRKAKIRAKPKRKGETKKKRGGVSDDSTSDEHDD